MPSRLLLSPTTDAGLVVEHLRGSYGTELLVAAVAHFNVFGLLADRPRPLSQLQAELGLADRPAMVLMTALRAMGLLTLNQRGELEMTPLAAEHLAPGSPFDIGDYVGLMASHAGVLAMVERLKSNRPAGADSHDEGTAFIYRAGVASAMERADLARHFTLALAGRARNVAPALAQRMPATGARTLLDVGGGTGIYSIALVQRNPGLRAIVLDRPEVLKIAAEFIEEYGVADRVELLAGDMFTDPLPAADLVLLSNVLHDWDVGECRQLVQRCAEVLLPGGRLWIHDVLLNDDDSGPLHIALYSAALFTLTEGRAYSGREYRGWLEAAGLRARDPVPTAVHCFAIEGAKQ